MKRLISSNLAIGIALTILASLAACQDNPSTIVTLEPPSEKKWIEVYFSQPESPEATDFRGGPAEALSQAIQQARLSVDVAAYEIDLWNVRDALREAHQRGVRVRLVTDSDHLGNREVQELIQAGIPVVDDRQDGLMHNKFTVIDQRDVWTGSFNLTVNSAYHNNDNLVSVISSELAENYTVEFEEMFLDRRFGASSPAHTPMPDLEVNGVRLEVYFSPDDGVAENLIEILSNAQESIYFMAYSFTSDEIANTILERARNGVNVQGLFDKNQVASNLGGEYGQFKEAGLDVRRDANPDNMHHKVMIIDRQIVVTGSYNFGYNAEEKNDENVLVIHDRQTASQFLEEFQRLFNAARP